MNQFEFESCVLNPFTLIYTPENPTPLPPIRIYRRNQSEFNRKFNNVEIKSMNVLPLACFAI